VESIHIHDDIIVNVNTAAPVLSPLFRSDTQAEILAQIFLNSDRGFTIAELARLSNAPYATAHREVSRLIHANLVAIKGVGRANLVYAATDSLVFAPLAQLLSLSYGPLVVLPRVLSPIPRINAAYIYGSWAARFHGSSGPQISDIDVLVIGDPPQELVQVASESAEKSLHREVTIRVAPEELWIAGTDLFVRTIQSQPLVELELGGSDDRAMGTRQRRH